MHLNIEDLVGQFVIETEDALKSRILSVRRGNYGAFIMCHDKSLPSLLLHINGEYCYLHYFPDSEGHPGYQPMDMTPNGCVADVTFIQTDGSEAGGFEMCASAIVPLEAAICASCDFLKNERLPGSIKWLEL